MNINSVSQEVLDAIGDLPGPLMLPFVPFALISGVGVLVGAVGGAIVAGGPDEHWYAVIENLSTGQTFVLEQATKGICMARGASSNRTSHLDDGYCKNRKVRKGKDIADWIARYRDNTTSVLTTAKTS